MSKEIESWGIKNIRVLYDKPTEIYKPLSHEEKMNFISKIDWSSEDISINTESEIASSAKFVFSGALKSSLIVSSTSWTEDEDFTILAEALAIYDQSLAGCRKIFIVITGKGPLKNYHMDKIIKLKLKQIIVRSCWLKHYEYAQLIACADFGVSLHASSSGLDLPMKIVDMFGCGIPVCALGFPWYSVIPNTSISELVIEGYNGLIFKSASQLADHFGNLLQPDSKLLKEMTLNTRKEGKRWDENWDEVMIPLLETF